MFYESWQLLDANSSVMTDEFEAITDFKEKCLQTKSSVTTDDLIETESFSVDEAVLLHENQIDINHAINISNIADFPIVDFFRVPFTHHIEIFKRVDALQARYYYIHRTAEEHLSVEALKPLLKGNAYEHRNTMPSNFSNTLSDAKIARKAVMMFKDEYLLDFINVEQIGERESIDVDEREVEHQIVQNVKNFIMTFGNDFAFIGNQYHLEVYGVEHFPDLLFFNRELNALVVVELKTGDFKSSYLGQLMSYLSILDAKVKKPHENPSIGIVLCKSANREYVEFVIRDYNKPLGVATYKTSAELPEELRKALPDMEELKKLL